MKKTLLALALLLSSSFTLQADNTEKLDKPYRLNLMSFNIRNGTGMDDVNNLDRTATVINHVSPDIVALQEVDSMTNRFPTDIAKNLAKKVGMHHYYAPAINFDGGKYGIALLSKEKAISIRQLALPGREEARALLIAEFDKHVVFATHFSLTEADQLTSCDIIKAELDKVNGKAVFFMGDLNALPKSEVIKKLDKTFLQLNKQTESTFPASEPTDHIDYIYLAPQNRWVNTLFTYVYADALASDHRAVVVGVEVK